MGAHLSSAEHDTISFGLRVGNVNPALAMLPQSHQPRSTSDTSPTAPCLKLGFSSNLSHQTHIRKNDFYDIYVRFM
jgi:hypothetical protein